MGKDWTVDEIELLIQKLEQKNVLANVKDVIWLLEQLKDPDAENQKYFREMVAA